MEQYRLLRGARILQQLNEDSTEPDLETNIRAAFPSTKKRQHATNEVTIQNIQYVPYVGTKFLHVKSTSQSNGNTYKQVIQFMRVNFENEDTSENVTFVGSDNEDYHIQPINLINHNVKVRCSCLDFYWRFAAWNFSDNSIVGRAPPLYQRKTDNRPPANPSQTPGLCKHLLKLVEILHGSKLLR